VDDSVKASKPVSLRYPDHVVQLVRTSLNISKGCTFYFTGIHFAKTEAGMGLDRPDRPIPKSATSFAGKALAGPAQATKIEAEEAWVKGELMKRGMSRSAPHAQVVKLVEVPAADRPKDAIGLLLAHKVSVLRITFDFPLLLLFRSFRPCIV
jgi:hypothetical protein